MNIDLSNKVVLITGGSRGIGASCVRLFSAAGAKVVFTYNTDKNSADRLIGEADNPESINAFRVDVKSDTDIKSCIDNVIESHGKIDILVNNAGIWKEAKVDELSLEQWNETINTNLTGSFLFAKYVVPLMKKQKYGRIINIASTAGQRGEADHSHYAASKGGMISFTKSLASELASFGITTNCVAPGWVYTDMSNEIILEEKKAEQIKEYIPIGRAAYPEEIAGPVLFLASVLADHVNGEILNVNGGSELCG